MVSIQFVCPITADAFMRGYDLLAESRLRRPFRIAVQILSAFLLVGGLIALWAKPLSAIGYACVILAAGWFGGLRLLNRYLIRRNFRRRKDNGRSAALTVDESGLHIQVPDHGGGLTTWAAFERAVIGKHGILLFVGGGTIFYWLPYAQMSAAQQEQVRQLVETKIEARRWIGVAPPRSD